MGALSSLVSLTPARAYPKIVSTFFKCLPQLEKLLLGKSKRRTTLFRLVLTEIERSSSEVFQNKKGNGVMVAICR